MTMQECDDRLGGNFEQMTKRLPSVSIIKKFVARFPEDPTFTELCRAMESGEQKEEFRAAHTLKGVCTNLGFDRLLAPTAELTELLRVQTEIIPKDAFALLDRVKADYELTVGVIRTFLAEDEQA